MTAWRLFSSRIEKYFTRSLRSLVKCVNTCPNKQTDKQTKKQLKYQRHELKQTGHTEQQLACTKTRNAGMPERRNTKTRNA